MMSVARDRQPISTAGAPDTTGVLAQQALGTQYQAFIAQTLLAQASGTVAAIADAEQSAALETAVFTDPTVLDGLYATIAQQMNDQSNGPIITDLASRIASVQLETIVQGASTLTVTIIDPELLLIRATDDHGNTFIEADATGYIWPPIDLNFPPGTDCWWRLCQVAPVLTLSQANVTLTFEDRIVSWLREIDAQLGGVYQGSSDQTLGGFIGSLVSAANNYLRGHPASGGNAFTPISLVQLIAPQDPNYVAPATAVGSPPPLRQNPNKAQQGLTAQQQQYVADYQQRLAAQYGPEFSFTSREGQAGGVRSVGRAGGSTGVGEG
jgi:hypothetical protein